MRAFVTPLIETFDQDSYQQFSLVGEVLKFSSPHLLFLHQQSQCIRRINSALNLYIVSKPSSQVFYFQKIINSGLELAKALQAYPLFNTTVQKDRLLVIEVELNHLLKASSNESESAFSASAPTCRLL